MTSSVSSAKLPLLHARKIGSTMRIALAQKNTKIGDFDAIDKIIADTLHQAREQRVDLVVFPSLFLIGGPADEFAARREIVQSCAARLETLAKTTEDGPAILIGFPEYNRADHGKGVYNSAALLMQGRVQNLYRQSTLANYGVKEEAQVYDPGPRQLPLAFDGKALGVMIGNDVWNHSSPWGDRAIVHDLANQLLRQSELLIHLDADPWFFERPKERLTRLRTLATRHQKWVLYMNAVGGHESVIYDGRSMAIAPNGQLVAMGQRFADDLLIIDLDDPPKEELPLQGDEVDETFDALVLGLRDGVQKSGFNAVTLGLSGGIDSALVAAIAYEALGPENVHCVALPSRYSSDHSIRDARAQADALKLPFSIIEIEGIYQALAQALAPAFEGTEEDTAEENLQARARGTILMGLSNKFQRLVLATSNKSEFAVGYCTLYGDMCGAFAILTDVPKGMVYRLSYRFNERLGFTAIPESTLTKPPSAELRPGQTDQDSLPPYDVLDEIVDRYLVRDHSAEEIVAAGFAPADVQRVVWLMNINGYKRQQAAPGLLISRRALAIGRRYPNIASYRALQLNEASKSPEGSS